MAGKKNLKPRIGAVQRGLSAASKQTVIPRPKAEESACLNAKADSSLRSE
jgi:hypothetical protein